uniref:B30.2/SPRY domain-containing protein n=1 Tax=Anabas testudineus TaxID=64144 RepID=A0AAQ6IBS8_ANATE
MDKKKKRKRLTEKSSESSEPSTSSQMSEAESKGISCVSMKSDSSKFQPVNFRAETLKCEVSEERSHCSVCKEDLKDPVLFMCGHQSCKQCVSFYWDQNDPPVDHLCHDCEVNSPNNTENRGDVIVLKTKKNLKKAMQEKFSLTSEGNGDKESSLKSIFTALFITNRESEGPHEEHPLRHIERKLKKQQLNNDSVSLSDIFKSLPGQETPHRTVLTKGVAGIGKSFAVQKFILDWSEEETNQDIDFVFCLSFRELNLSRGEKSLHQLLTEFHPVLCDLKDSENYIKSKMIVILDGLDESRLQLDFDKNKVVKSVSEVTSVSNLLVNLIQGNLLPDAHLWITSRPAASSQIPAKYVDMVTEIRGFSDLQKEEYFRRRFSHDSSLAARIISHVQSSQSLHIMCQIPIFCWISAVLFEEVFRGDEKDDIPQTLTEMMAHFVFVQTKRRSRKYDKTTEENKEKPLKTYREFLLKLGKLAFVHLQKNNLIFYEEDLEDCGIDINEASIYSGFCNAVLREEKIFSQKKVFFFVHLTVQEFFAALFVFDCLTYNNTTDLSDFLNLKNKERTLLALLKMTVDKVIERKNGHLDFFLRFLLGLMVEPNRRVLHGLLTSPDQSQDTDKKILTYLKSIRRKTLSPDNFINLFQAMVEMRDHKVKDEIQEYLKLSDRSKTELTPLHCSALAYMLQVSKDDLEVLDLKSYNTSDEGRRRLIPAVMISRKVLLADCRMTSDWIEYLTFALKFSYSALRVLDLSNSDLKDSGVEQLCSGLSNQCCRLETLRLSGCHVTETGCRHLASALKSNPSHLKDLDLSYNNPGVSGEKLLTELKNDPQYKLSILNTDHGGSHRMKPGIKKYGCELTLDPRATQKNILLSERYRKVTWVEEGQPHSQQQTDHFPQVLCEQGLVGRCYWEVEVFGYLSIGVKYRDTEKNVKMDDFKFGHNERSWSLVCSSGDFHVQHNSEKVYVSSLGWRSSRVGVFLDWPAGTLSFYRVSSDSLIHLHTFKATFTEPLYPAAELHPQSSALFCKPR